MISTVKRWATLLQCMALLVILTGCAMTTVRQHPEFASDKRQIKTVAILPPEVEYTYIVFSGDNERMPAKENEIRSYLASAAQSSLKQCGYAPQTTLLEKLNSGSDKSLMFDYEQFKTAYEQASKELYKARAVDTGESTKFRVSTGLTSNSFVNSSGADALLLMRYQGFEKSGGQQAKDIVASALLMALVGSAAVPAPFGGSVEVALIDGRNGEVLWSNVFGAPQQRHTQVFRQAITPFEKQYKAKQKLAASATSLASTSVELAKADETPSTAVGALVAPSGAGAK